MHLIKYNKVHILKHNAWYHTYMFRHQSFVFTESVNTKNNLSNTLFQVLIALTVIFETLKNPRIYKVDKYEPTSS